MRTHEDIELDIEENATEIEELEMAIGRLEDDLDEAEDELHGLRARRRALEEELATTPAEPEDISDRLVSLRDSQDELQAQLF